jgi:hypothetical protein
MAALRSEAELYNWQSRMAAYGQKQTVLGYTLV